MKIAAFIIVLTLTGCVTTASYDEFYNQQAPSKFAPTETVVFVDADSGVDATYNFLFDKFLVIGRMEFSGPWEGREPYISYAKKVGADIVIASTKFESERQVQSSYSVPSSNTTYLSGYGSNGTYFSGTATSYGTTEVPYSYTVRRYNHKTLFLKRLTSDAKAPWEYTKSDFPPSIDSSKFNGIWKNDSYVIEVMETNNQVVGFVQQVTSISQKELSEVNPSLHWTSGDLKFRFDRESGLGFYLMAIKSPRPAKIDINKFGHLEVQLTEKDKFSFMRLNSR